MKKVIFKPGKYRPIFIGQLMENEPYFVYAEFIWKFTDKNMLVIFNDQFDFKGYEEDLFDVVEK